MSTCSVQLCDRPHEAKGYCRVHYARVRRHGSPDPRPRVSQVQAYPKGCVVEGCELKHASKGYCATHYARAKRHGSPEVLLQPRRARKSPSCEVDGCGMPDRARGLCNAHYQRFNKHGDVNAVMPTPFGRGPLNWKWVGDEADYGVAHARVRREYGPASSLTCEGCGEPASDWCYDYADPAERVSEMGSPYSLDLGRYFPLCKSCHKKHDLLARRLDKMLRPSVQSGSLADRNH